MLGFSGYIWLLLVATGLQFACAEDTAVFPSAGEEKLVHFDKPCPHVVNPLPGIYYEYDLSKESFRIFVPKNYTGKEAFGLFVFMNSGDQMSMPGEWVPIVEKEKMICLMPLNIGNNQVLSRRLGLTLVGILKMKGRYNIDPHRIYSSGLSGGGRAALRLAFVHSDVISGDISICGADFYQPVPVIHAKDTKDYGVWPVPPNRVNDARRKVRFVFVTGANDFRYGNIQDIYQNGFAKDGFQALLIDQPGMGHGLCNAASLLRAFRFVDRAQ